MKRQIQNLKSEIRNLKLSDFLPPFLIFLISTFLCLFVLSCKKEHVTPGSNSFNYFPTEQGRYVIYEVDSVLHSDNDNNTDDSVYHWHFQIKEVIDETFIDGEGRLVQVIRRFRRDNDSLEWIQENVCTQLLTLTAAYRTEDNIIYHRLAFPISGNTKPWNGNDMNTLDEEMYEYEGFHVPIEMNSLAFDSTLSVLQVDEDNFVERIYGEEIYANHVGLIFRQRDNLHKINGLPVTGSEFKMQVLSFGNE
jgi:hypothetical protein